VRLVGVLVVVFSVFAFFFFFFIFFFLELQLDILCWYSFAAAFYTADKTEKDQ